MPLNPVKVTSLRKAMDRNDEARIADLGATAFTSSPAELDKIVVEQTEKWGKVIRTANIKAE